MCTWPSLQVDRLSGGIFVRSCLSLPLRSEAGAVQARATHYIPTSIARYDKYRCWASKLVSEPRFFLYLPKTCLFSAPLRVRFEERLGKPMCLQSEPLQIPIGRTNSTRGQLSDVSEYGLKSHQENRCAFNPEPFWKPIGRANSTRGQPYILLT